MTGRALGVALLLVAHGCRPGAKEPERAAGSDEARRFCPEGGAPCRVMPFGDSITDAYNAPGGYRVGLFRAARRDGRRIHFVGSERNGPARVDGAAFPRAHEGHSGYTIDAAPDFNRRGITALAGEAIDEHRPHVVLLMIATNDVSLDLDLADAPARLGRLMDRILDRDPNLLLVVAQITPTRDEALNLRATTFNAAIPALVAGRVAAGRHVLLADMYSAFTKSPDYQERLLEDALHPSQAGYDRMAEAWYAVVKSAL
jgi:lysophospholipase L1-like esterase